MHAHVRDVDDGHDGERDDDDDEEEENDVQDVRAEEHEVTRLQQQPSVCDVGWE